MTTPRVPEETTLAEFAEYGGMLHQLGSELMSIEDDIATAEDREARRTARRNRSPFVPDAVGRGLPR